MPIRRLMSIVVLFCAVCSGAAEPTPPDESAAASLADQPEVAAPAVTPAPAGAPAVAAPPIISSFDDRIAVAAHAVETGEYVEAEQQLTTTIAEIERATWRYDRSLAQPLELLGDALAGQGKYTEALPVYEQARHVIRVNDGLHAPAQIPIVYKEASTLTSMGDIAKANARQEYAYETLFKNHDRYDEALVPGVMHLAEWYERTGNTFAARELYEYAVIIETRAHGDMDPSLIPPLIGAARTYREERFPPVHIPEPQEMAPPLSAPGGFPTVNQPVTINRFGLGEQALQRVVRITDANPNAAPIDVALAELALADWYQLFDQRQSATKMYIGARALMRSKAGLTEDQIAAYFDPPQPLWVPIPPPRAPEVRTRPTQGHVAVSYTLTERGDCTDLKTIESQPEGLMDTRVRRGLAVARFRPHFEGDTPVALPNQVYRHTFTYYPQASSAPPADDSKGEDTSEPSAASNDDDA